MRMASLVTRLTAVAAVCAAAVAGAGAAAQTATEVRLVAPSYSAQTLPLLEEAAAAFEAEHPEIDVVVEVVGWDSLFQVLTADISAGTPPELAVVASAWVADLAGEDALEPLDDRMEPALRAAFVPALLAPTRFGDALLGLPFAASVRALYYNRALFEEAGLDGPPATWEELEAAARAVSAPGEGRAGFGLQGGEIETDVYFYHALWPHGGEIVRPDGQSGLGDERAIAVAEMYRRFIDEGLTQPDVVAFSRQDLQALFADGRLGMVIAGPPFAAQLARQAPTLRYGIVPVPAAVRQASFGATDSIVMFRDAAAKDAAAAFLAHLFQSGWQADFATREGLLPTTTQAALSDAVTGDPALAPFAALLPRARFTPAVADWEVIADLTSAALRRLYAGDQTPREALSEAAAEMDSILER